MILSAFETSGADVTISYSVTVPVTVALGNETIAAQLLRAVTLISVSRQIDNILKIAFPSEVRSSSTGTRYIGKRSRGWSSCGTLHTGYSFDVGFSFSSRYVDVDADSVVRIFG